jgi:phosphoenolpyruvate carboxylase
MLPGWFGFGAAVEQFLASHSEPGMGLLREMYRPLAVLSRAFVQYGHGAGQERYAYRVALCGTGDRSPTSRSYFQPHSQRNRCFHSAPAGYPEQRELLESNPFLARSFRNRVPYIDPLNHLQVEALRRYRAGITDDNTKRTMLLTMNGIAAGLRNSG